MALAEAPNRTWGNRVSDSQDLPERGSSATREQVGEEASAPWQQDVIPTQPREQGPSSCCLEQGQVKESVRGMEDTVAAEHRSRDRPDEVELVADLADLPVTDG
jgi:hypothetical protein